MDPKNSVKQLVVVGSSAGGIEALSRLVSNLPVGFPAPIVIAQHLDPQRASHLQSILSRPSPLPVKTVENQTPLELATVYVVPSNQNVMITDHDVSLQPPGAGPKPSIDMLLSSAARIFQENLIAVVLTGTGSDGAVGAEEVKRAGGTVIIQDPMSAQYPALPLSLAPTVVDLALPLDDMGPKLFALLREPPSGVEKRDVLDQVLRQVEDHSAIDFGSYKRATIVRRLQRRMVATNNATVEDYVQYLAAQPSEYRYLVDNFLIKVTEFFRDPRTFAAIRERVFPAIIDNATRNDGEIRIWSAGCATGEEAYSLAILLTELLGDDLSKLHVRIFATDLDNDAVDFARRGVYPSSAVQGVPDDLLARHFTYTGNEYQVKKSIRSMMLFGQHDLGNRPPFPRIDLLVCRNVLIYFTQELQQHVMRLFAFSLRDSGYLLLGKSKTVNTLSDYFVVEDARLKIYRRRGDRPSLAPPRFTEIMRSAVDARSHRPVNRTHPLQSLAKHSNERDRPSRLVESENGWGATFQQISAGIVIVDRRYNIQYINMMGRQLLGVYGPAIGDDLVHVAQHSPGPDLRMALERVFRSRENATLTDLRFSEPPDPTVHHLHVDCRLIHGEMQGRSGQHVVVTVYDVTPYREEALASQRERESLETLNSQAKEQLTALSNSMSDLRKANEDLTSENLELRSANEEFLVGNEELQAGAEEVETLNEELQASNEELETLNEELQATVEELNATNEDLHARSRELETASESEEEARHAAESQRARLEIILAGMADAVLVVNKNQEAILANQSFHNLFGPGRRQ